MFFTFAVFLSAVFLFHFKVIIRTVIKKYLIISFSEEVGVFINFSLDKIIFSSKYIQCPINIMKFIGGFL